MDPKRLSTLAIIGGVLMAVGSFLTWATLSGDAADKLITAGEWTSKTGIGAGDGFVTLFVGLALIVTGFMGFRGRELPLWFGWIAATLGVATTAFYYFSLSDRIDALNNLRSVGVDANASVGLGYYLVAAGALLGIIGVALGRQRKMA